LAENLGGHPREIPILKSNAQNFANSSCHNAIHEPR
jgi:hypothetical protein